MSSKTSFKRIAVVAASALAIAGFSAVPAWSVATVSAGGVVMTTPTATGAIGVISTSTFAVTATAAAATDTITYTFAITTKPNASSLAKFGATSDGAAVASAKVKLLTGVDTTNAKYTQSAGTDTLIDTVQADPTQLTAEVRGAISLKPDAPGTYVITVTATGDVAATGSATAAISATFTVVVPGAAGAATATNSISLSTATAAPTVGAAVSANFAPNTDSLGAIAKDFAYTYTGYLSSYPSSGFKQVTASTTGTTGSWVALGGTTPVVTESASGSNYIVTLDGNSGNETYTGNTTVASATVGAAQFAFTPTVAGTYVMTVWNDADVDGLIDIGEAVQTLSITVAAASGYSNSLSTLHSINTAGTAAADATTNLVALTGSSTMATATRGSLTISLKDAAGVAMTTGNTITATMSGVGGLAATATLAMTANTPTATDCSATTVARAISAAADAVNTISICSDGNSGVGTITVSVTNAAGTTTILGTKTITFYGAVTKIEATGLMTIAKAGGGTTGASIANRDGTDDAPAVIVKATDANGNLVTGLTISALSADITKINSAITSNEDVASTANIYSSGGSGYYNISVSTPSSAASGDSVVLTFRIADPADATGATFLTSPVTFTMGGTTVVTETLSLDSDSYTSGQAMVITRTALDSAGNKVADGTASPAVAFTKAVGGTAPVAGIYVGGISATSSTAPSVFAPTNSGDFSAYMTSGNAAGSTITVAATVAADEQSSLALDAANAATDAAENAYDEAQNATQAASDALAAVTALAKQVQSLIAQVKKLAKAVSKL